RPLVPERSRRTHRQARRVDRRCVRRRRDQRGAAIGGMVARVRCRPGLPSEHLEACRWMSDPFEIEVVVEIPRGSRNKYEIDHYPGAVCLARILFTATQCPTDYGFVPDTLAEDGDPIDVLVLLDEPTFPGCHIRARPVAVFWMRDEKGPDAKVLCVPA